MGIAERRERHRHRLRQRVLEAAEALFAAKGYEHASMRNIAAAIEYSPTTIYRLFRNKAEIMHTLIADGYRRVREQYDRVLEQDHGSPFEALAAILGVYVEFALDNPHHYQLWYATSEIEAGDRELRMRHGELDYVVYGTWLDQIDACRRAEMFPDQTTNEVFQVIWSAVHGLIMMRLRHPGLGWMPRDTHLQRLIEMIAGGLAHRDHTR